MNECVSLRKERKGKSRFKTAMNKPTGQLTNSIKTNNDDDPEIKREGRGTSLARSKECKKGERNYNDWPKKVGKLARAIIISRLGLQHF